MDWKVKHRRCEGTVSVYCTFLLFMKSGLVNAPARWYDIAMKHKSFSAGQVSSLPQWIRIYCLYRRAFPRYERKPFSIIRSMWKKGKTDVWYFENSGRFAGFAATINDSELILLDYLAVSKNMRGQGIGSRILSVLKEFYGGKGLFVEIESAYEAVPNREERLRRKAFYLKNGMQPSCVMASVFDVNMELLCWNCSVDFSTYHAFYRDNYSQWAAQHIIEADYPRE